MKKHITIAEFSGRGPIFDGINKPDIVAPCIDIVSLNSDTKYIPTAKHKYSISTPYKSASGTSIACAIICASIALILEKYNNVSIKDIKSLLTLSSKSIGESKNAQGSGMFVFDKIIK
ncbi:S8 family serine peptidase [Caloramator sp. mosi_1]|uniref:S8 family serine peptidase n=1 Tax=Caloramator sp. mosi_1 TaxID=3023090 RepID=UPI003FCE41A6